MRLSVADKNTVNCRSRIHPQDHLQSYNIFNQMSIPLTKKKLKIMDEMRTYIYKRHGKEIDRQEFATIEEAEAYGCGICATEIVVPEVKPTKAKEDSTNV